MTQGYSTVYQFEGFQTPGLDGYYVPCDKSNYGELSVGGNFTYWNCSQSNRQIYFMFWQKVSGFCIAPLSVPGTTAEATNLELIREGFQINVLAMELHSDSRFDWWEHSSRAQSLVPATVVCRQHRSDIGGMPQYVKDRLLSAKVLSEPFPAHIDVGNANSLDNTCSQSHWIGTLKELKCLPLQPALPSSFLLRQSYPLSLSTRREGRRAEKRVREEQGQKAEKKRKREVSHSHQLVVSLGHEMVRSSSRGRSFKVSMDCPDRLVGCRRRCLIEPQLFVSTGTRRRHCVEGTSLASCSKDGRRSSRKRACCTESGLIPAFNCPEEGIQEFYKFMRERESIRIRRARGQEFPWSSDPVLQKLRVTNVKRENDRTTVLVKSLIDLKRQEWYAAQSQESREAIAQQWIFNIAVWRRFGSWDFIYVMGLKEVPRTEEELHNLIEELCGVAVDLWTKGICACSDAYFPTKRCHSFEHSAWFHKGKSAASSTWKTFAYRRRLIMKIKDACRFPVSQRKVEQWRAHLVSPEGKDRVIHGYRTLMTHRDPIKGIWQNLRTICNSLRIGQEEQSWKQVVLAFQSVNGYGGTGFLAKELTQDLLLTPAMINVTDVNAWSAIGPGARRGINRVRCKELRYNAGEADFLNALQEIFAARLEHWPAELEGEKSEELVLHDIQFQLCEYDKYLREKFGERRQRRIAFFPFEHPMGPKKWSKL